MPEPSAQPTGPASAEHTPGEGHSPPARLEDLEDLRADLLEDLPAAVAKELRQAKAAGEALLTPRGVAQRLSISKRTVERLVADGELRPLWVGGQRRFTPAAVDAYLRSAARSGQRGAAA